MPLLGSEVKSEDSSLYDLLQAHVGRKEELVKQVTLY